MDLMQAIRFPFDDRDWIGKTVVGALMMVLGAVLPFIPMGYQLYVTREVMRGHSRPLPGAGDLGVTLSEGLIAFVASLIYALPILVLSCCLAVAGFVLGSSDTGSLLMLCLSLCLGTFALVYGVLAGALFLVGMIRYAQEGDFVAFLRFGELWEQARAHSDVLIELVIYLLVLGVAGSVVVTVLVVTIIGVPVALFFLSVASGHLIGQAGRAIARA